MSNNHFVICVISLLCGALFGFGLALSDMINPARVLSFLDISGDWDATLLFVMLGALTVTIPAYYFILQRKQPLLADSFDLPVNKEIDLSLIMGAILFGLGWGLIGLCPGPAISGLVLGLKEIWIFVAAMFVGFFLFEKRPWQF